MQYKCRRLCLRLVSQVCVLSYIGILQGWRRWTGTRSWTTAILVQNSTSGISNLQKYPKFLHISNVNAISITKHSRSEVKTINTRIMIKFDGDAVNLQYTVLTGGHTIYIIQPRAAKLLAQVVLLVEVRFPSRH